MIDEDNNVGYHVCSTSEVKKIIVNHKWVVYDAFTALYQTHLFNSPSFDLLGNLGTGNLCLTIDDHSDIFGSCDLTVSLNITLICDQIQKVLVKAFALLPNGRRTKLSKENQVSEDCKNVIVKLNDFITTDELFDWGETRTDIVTIFCEFTIARTIFSSIGECHHETPLPKSSLGMTLGMFIDDSKYSDLTITVGSKKFQVHKMILSARSSVFRARVEFPATEEEEDNIDITDMSEETVRELLNFIYTDTIHKRHAIKMELLDAAEKYDLKNLKLLCVECLHNQRNVDNAIDNLILAEHYNLKEAKECVLRFISSHKRELIKTKKYKAMKETHPYLVIEAFEIEDHD